MLGFLIFLPTVSIIPHFAFLLPVFYVLLPKSYTLSRLIKMNDREYFTFVIVISIVFLSLFNRTLAPSYISTWADIIPYQVLYFLTFILVLNLKDNDIKILIILIFFESLVIIYEFYIGVNSLFETGTILNRSDELMLLYNRPYGLSANSSNAASKLFIFFILTDLFFPKNKLLMYMKPFGVIAMILIFNRTAMFCYFIYLSLKWCVRLASTKLTKINYFVIISSIFILLFIGIQFYDIIEFQLTGGTEKFRSLSYREIIWKDFISNIYANPLLGNNSFKLKVEFMGRMMHAHNSFLQVLATNGVIIFLLYLLMTIINLNKKNIIYVLPVLLFSMTQYSLFWGISIEDITFFTILLHNKQVAT